MLNKISNFTILFFTFLFPVFFLPFTSEYYEYNKMVLFISVSIFLFFISGLTMIKERKLKIVKSSFGLSLFLITVITILSTLIQSPNIASSLLTPLSASSWIAGLVFYFSSMGMAGQKDKERVINVLIFSSLFVSLYTILLFFKIIPPSAVTPAGTLFFTFIFLLVILVCIMTAFIKYRTRLFYHFSFFLTALSLCLLAILLTTSQKPILLPHIYGWTIFLEVLKNPKTLLLGTGPANFVTAFTLAKPFSFNAAPFWNIIFTSSSSYLLTLATESGLVSATLFLLLFVKSLKPPLIPLLAVLLLTMILPANMTIFITLIILLAVSARKEIFIEFDLSKLGRLIYLFVIPVLILSAFPLYFLGKAYGAEIFFKKSLDMMSKGLGNEVYQYQIEAISYHPFPDSYHLAFSQTNLALANALARKKELTNEDKQNIPRLVQQAIDQAKIATVLNRTNILNWDNLGRTYASLINFAADSDKWAIQSYEQRNLLDPLNPGGYLTLGGFYLMLNKYAEAESQFRKAVMLKPDFANAHFNLGLTLKGQKKYEEARKELEITRSYLKDNSPDAQKVDAEINTLIKLLPGSQNPEPATPSGSVDQDQTIEPALVPTIASVM